MFDFIGKLFRRYKVKSFEEFVELMKREGCRSAVVEPYTVITDKARVAGMGVATPVQYMLDFTTTTPRGRKVVYGECFFERIMIGSAILDQEDSHRAKIEIFLRGEQKVRELQEKLPGVSVDLLLGLNGQPLDNMMYAEIHREAAACGVSA